MLGFRAEEDQAALCPLTSLPWHNVRFLRVGTNSRASFFLFLMAEPNSIFYTVSFFVCFPRAFIHSPIRGPLACFPLLATDRCWSKVFLYQKDTHRILYSLVQRVFVARLPSAVTAL